MSRDIFKRNETIYKQYTFGVDEESLSNRYNLKVSTIKKIINSQKTLHKQRENTLDELHNHLRLYLDLNVSTRVKHSLYRYLYNHYIYKKDDIKSLFEDDIYIRGIGKNSTLIIKEYFEI